MIGLVLALAMVAPQDAPIAWVKLTEIEGVSIEIANVQAKGDLRDVDVRASKGGGEMRYSMTVNCKAQTSVARGGINVYSNGQFVQNNPFPPGTEGDKPVSADPIAAPVAASVCK